MESILANALGQDVTELAADEKRRLLSRLLGRLAHEIRNPLSSLEIHVQLLEEDLAGLAPQAREQLAGRLEIIHGELHRLESIVRQFLRLTGPSALNLAPVHLEKVVGHICNLLEPEAAARRIEVVTRLEGLAAPVMGDADQLIQALLNLVINALQAVDQEGRVELRATAGQDAVVIEIRDTGPGIPAERMARLFEPYYTTKPEGSGIGLWIAQQIFHAHGGTIHAANAPEGGAVFTAALPLRPPPSAHGQDQN